MIKLSYFDLIRFDVTIDRISSFIFNTQILRSVYPTPTVQVGQAKRIIANSSMIAADRAIVRRRSVACAAIGLADRSTTDELLYLSRFDKDRVLLPEVGVCSRIHRIKLS